MHTEIVHFVPIPRPTSYIIGSYFLFTLYYIVPCLYISNCLYNKGETEIQVVDEITAFVVQLIWLIN